ncbi:FG-GAP repeat domain-containing protein, partial [Spirochaetota bacterium]
MDKKAKKMELKKALKALSVLFIVLSFSFLSAELPTFTYVPIENACAMSRVIGDCNGDGKGDLVAIGGKYDDQSIIVFAWYEYPDLTKHNINMTELSQMGYNGDADMADMDGDGDLDIITLDTKKPVGTVRIFLNPGNLLGNPNETWPVKIAYTVNDCHEMKDLEIADFDQDGKLDIGFCDNKKLTTGNIARMYVSFQNSMDDWTTKSFSKRQTEGLAAGDVSGDGLVDLVIGGAYYKNPGDRTSSWSFIQIDSIWYSEPIGWPKACTMARVADFNKDGLLDMAVSDSEDGGKYVTVYTAPDWSKQQIEIMEKCQTLQPADFDNDGDMDLVAGEMYAGTQRRIKIYWNNDGAFSASDSMLVDNTKGIYHGVVGDYGGDFDIDILGVQNFRLADVSPNYIYLFENKLDPPDPNGPWPIDPAEFVHIVMDNTRQQLVGKEDIAGLYQFGFDAKDVDGDDDLDILNGRYFYRNPGGDMDLTSEWKAGRIDFNVLYGDAITYVDVDGDENVDAIMLALLDNGKIYWIEFDTSGTGYTKTAITTSIKVPATKHVNTQGWGVAEVGGRMCVFFEGGNCKVNANAVYGLEIPADPSGTWTAAQISGLNESGDALATGDVDGDGMADVISGSINTKQVLIFKNPGSISGNWAKTRITTMTHQPDKAYVADVNGDNMNDIIISEETYGGTTGGGVYWFDGASSWVRSQVMKGDSINSLDMCDMDNDGDIDVVCADRETQKALYVCENDGSGVFTKIVINNTLGKDFHG